MPFVDPEVRREYNRNWHLTHPRKERILNIQEIFMPNGQCARCGELPPKLWADYKFKALKKLPLGFCSEGCFRRFEAAKAHLQKVPFVQSGSSGR